MLIRKHPMATFLNYSQNYTSTLGSSLYSLVYSKFAIPSFHFLLFSKLNAALPGKVQYLVTAT